MEDYTRYRETSQNPLESVYAHIMRKPTTKSVDISNRVSSTLKSLKLGKLDMEKKWLIQLYSADLYEQFGGLSIVEKRLLLVSIMTLLRNKKVAWQMVL